MNIENIYDSTRNTNKAAIQNDEQANTAFHHLRESLSFGDRALLRDLLDYVRHVGPKATRFETKIGFRPKMPWPEIYTVKSSPGFALVVVDDILGEAVGWCTHVDTVLTNKFISWTTVETDVIQSKTIEQAEATMFKQLCPNQD